MQYAEIDGLYYIATVIIHFRGKRMLAQSIIPGILNNSDMSSLSEYGSVDDKQTIHHSEDFHKLMTTYCEKMFIGTNKIQDKSGKTYEIAGSAEVKGIRGTDKRAYIVDLQGVVPRDANWKGDENHTCLIRQELLVLYNRNKSVEYAKKRMADEFEESMNKERDEEVKKVIDGKEEKDLSDE